MLLNLVGYVVGTLALSPLADRAGRRDLLLVTMVISGVGSALTALVGSYGWFVAARTITIGSSESGRNAIPTVSVPSGRSQRRRENSANPERSLIMINASNQYISILPEKEAPKRQADLGHARKECSCLTFPFPS